MGDAWKSRLALLLIGSVLLLPIAARAGEVPDDRARVSFVEGVLDEDGQLWFKVGFYVPWDSKPPSDVFSLFWGLTITVGEVQSFVGWQTHDGEPQFLGDPGTQAFILDNGCVVVATGIFPSGDFGVSVNAEFASWQDETTTEAIRGSESMGTSAEFIGTGDPFTAFGGAPVFDLTSGEMVSGETTTTSSTTTSSTTTSSTTTTQASTATTGGSVDGGTTGIVLDDGGGLAPFWWIVFVILAFGIFYWLIVFQFRWWVPPWAWLPKPGPRYSYRVAGGMYEVIEETPQEPEKPDEGKEETKPDDEGQDDTATQDRDPDDTDTETDTGEEKEDPYSTKEGGDGGTPPAVFEDRTPDKPDCAPLRAECERLKEIAARLEVEAQQAEEEQRQAEQDCEDARQRIAVLEAKVADLGGREDATQRYQRLAEAQQDLRDARAGLGEVCGKVDPLRSAAKDLRRQVAEAKQAADEACRKAEECEKQAGA